MSNKKPSTAKGTRDFDPVEMGRRNYILHTIREVFELYGFQPIETPAMENLETLEGKYGEEGSKLLFRILDSGDYLRNAKRNPERRESKLGEIEADELRPKITSKGLRYDLTIPFARYVVMNQHEINFPFRRYQIQPVWRADKPQKGRYREFFQCDADVIGSDSLINEVELIQIYDEVFKRLGIDITIRLNNRKILEGLSEVTGTKDKFTSMTVAIDKLDKIGVEGVKQELITNDFSEDSANRITSFLEKSKDNFDEVLEELKGSEIGRKGVEEINFITNYLGEGHNNRVLFDLTLARGLDYYTGTILEVTANGVSIGSIGGGGRYDDLTGVFGLKGVSGIGISFGLDRIYDVMEELGKLQDIHTPSTQVLFAHFDEESARVAFDYVQQLRLEGIPAEVYPDVKTKLGKQFKYADGKSIPYVVTIGSEEIKSGLLSIKNMKTGEQLKQPIEEIVNSLKSKI